MIPLYKVVSKDLDQDYIAELTELLDNGYVGYSKNGRILERNIGRFLGTNNFLLFNSYSNAYLTLIKIIDLEPGDEVIVSPICCLASIQPFSFMGINLKFADVIPEYGTIDPDSVQKKITKKTKAIIANHFCGYVCDINRLNHIAKENGLYLINDCIEAFGSEYKNQRIGSSEFDLSIFSFQSVRKFNTIDGGGLSINNTSLHDRAALLRDLGVERKTFRDDLGEISKSGTILSGGLGATPNELFSIIGLRNLRTIKEDIEHSRSLSELYDDLFSKIEFLSPLKITKNSKPNFWVKGFLCNENKNETIKKIRELGIYASSVHININSYEVYKTKEKFNGVEYFQNKFIALPSGPWLTSKELKKRISKLLT